MERSVRSMIKYEILSLLRSEDTIGLFISSMALPVSFYSVQMFEASTDSGLGLAILSICVFNILHGPMQFIRGKKYFIGLLTRNLDPYQFIIAKMGFLKLTNVFMFLLVCPGLIFYYDSERFSFCLSFFIYTFTFATPLIVLLSSLFFSLKEDAKSRIHNKNRFGLSKVALGILPFLPELIIITFLGNNTWMIIAINFILGFIGFIFTRLIIGKVRENLIRNKFLF